MTDEAQTLKFEIKSSKDIWKELNQFCEDYEKIKGGVLEESKLPVPVNKEMVGMLVNGVVMIPIKLAKNRYVLKTTLPVKLDVLKGVNFMVNLAYKRAKKKMKKNLEGYLRKFDDRVEVKVIG